MAQTEFGVKYDGPALTDGVMDVRDLAPSLLALGEMFTTASKILHPDREPVSLNIKATSEGSFDVIVMLQAGGLWDHFVDVFSGDTMSALVNLENLIIGTGTGVLWSIRRFHGRVVRKREVIAPGRTRVELDDSSAVEVPDDLLMLHEHVEMRKTTRKFIEPLRRDGIDEIGFFSEEVTTVSIRRGDLRAFDVPEPEAVQVSRNKVNRTLTIVSPVFKDGNKWLFSDGDGGSFYAAILDDGFRSRVNASVERFGHGDMLKATVLTTQTRRGNVLSAEHEIVKVIEHTRAQTQIPFGADGADTEAPAA
ncbi:MAG TPA: hypothetical protein VKB25_07930 [Conexibacter sp.]|nr:hypothetical protein [Conexibacter sp.]